MLQQINELETIQPYCLVCGNPSGSEYVVACYNCNHWYHCSYAGEGEITEGRKWLCTDCVRTVTLLDNHSRSGKSKESTRSARVRLQLQQLEEAKLAEEKLLQEKQELERKRQEKELEEKAALQKRYLDQKYALLFEEADEEMDSVRSGISQMTSSSKVRQWMLAQRKQLAEAALYSANIAAALNKAGKVPQTGHVGQCVLPTLGGKTVEDLGVNGEAGVLSNGIGSAPAGSSTMLEELEKLQQQRQIPPPFPLLRTPATPSLPDILSPTPRWPPAPPPSPLFPLWPLLPLPDPPMPHPPMQQPPFPQPPFPHPPLPDPPMPQPPMPHPPLPHPPLPRPPMPQPPFPYPPLPDPPMPQPPMPQPSLPHPPLPHPPLPDPPMPQPPMPQPPYSHPQVPPHLQFQQQLAARQVVPRELPIFTGNPEDWPLFVSCYRNSTELCGYSDAENLMRLQKSLRGCALEAVRSNLLLPSSVPQIMGTLETLFGGSERLVQSLLNKVRNAPTPKPEKLETLISFGLVVQNLVGHMKAANQHAHLTNPALLHELVEKLPANIRLDWALYKQRVGVVDLGTFGDYMAAIISAASDVSSFSGIEGMSKTEKGKDRAFVNVHMPDEGNKVSAVGRHGQSQGMSCFACNGSDHRARDCRNFKSKSLNDRLELVRIHQLCVRCLVPHGRWPCKATRVCSVNGCKQEHHPLLHPEEQDVEESSEDEAEEPAVVSVHRVAQNSTLFRIVPVVLYGSKGRLETYAFLDEGSSVTLVEESIADELGVTGEVQPLCLAWTSKVKHREAKSRRVHFEISGKGQKKCYPVSNVRTVSSLDLPVQTMCYGNLAEKFAHLKGLPVESYDKAEPRLLIGLDNLQLALTLKSKEGRVNEPVAAKTRIGWTVFGSTGGSNTTKSVSTLHIHESINDNEHNNVGKSTVENVSVDVTQPTREESYMIAEQKQKTTEFATSRDRVNSREDCEIGTMLSGADQVLKRVGASGGVHRSSKAGLVTLSSLDRGKTVFYGSGNVAGTLTAGINYHWVSGRHSATNSRSYPSPDVAIVSSSRLSSIINNDKRN